MSDPTSPFYPADNPATLAHITLLQGIITRLAGNSASCKTWCLTLVGVLLSLAAAAHASVIAAIAIIPVVFFGFLDAMYLGEERAYRDLYGTVTSSTGSTKAIMAAMTCSPSMPDPLSFACSALLLLGQFGRSI
jgi:hypothetical protein